MAIMLAIDKPLSNKAAVRIGRPQLGHTDARVGWRILVAVRETRRVQSCRTHPVNVPRSAHCLTPRRTLLLSSKHTDLVKLHESLS